MSTRDFDWDKHVVTETFKSISERSPTLRAGRPVPSLYSPDYSQLYLSSVDISVAAADVDELTAALREVGGTYGRSVNGKHVDHLKVAHARIDFLELCHLLSELVEEPEQYGDPDELLLSAARLS
jgi:hypothetical protein